MSVLTFLYNITFFFFWTIVLGFQLFVSFQRTEQTLKCQTFPSNRSSFPPVNFWAWHFVAEIGKTKKSCNEPIIAGVLVLKSSVGTALNSWSFFYLLASSLQISLVAFFKMVLFSSVKFKAQIEWAGCLSSVHISLQRTDVFWNGNVLS